MSNKVFYFKIGNKDVRVSWPTNTMAQILTILFATLFLMDLYHGALLNALIMFIFTAIHVVDIR